MLSVKAGTDAVPFGARTTPPVLEAGMELDVAVEFSTRMCGEYAKFVGEEVSVGVVLVSSVVVGFAGEDVIWPAALSGEAVEPTFESK